MVDAPWDYFKVFLERRWLQITLGLCPTGTLISLQAQAEIFGLLSFLSFRHGWPVIKEDFVMKNAIITPPFFKSRSLMET